MNGPQLSPIRKAWYRWKSLKLPWRKRFLVGLDLQGNTYWEFHDALTAGRMRRLVEYPSSTHYSDIKITPQWHQWLRHTRRQPPSLSELSQDLVRQEQLRVLAKRADERWAAKESYLDSPRMRQRLPGIAVRDGGGYAKGADSEWVDVADEGGRGVENHVVGAEELRSDRDEVERSNRRGPIRPEEEKRSKLREQEVRGDPLKKARGGPSEEWQPQAWSGGAVKRR